LVREYPRRVAAHLWTVIVTVVFGVLAVAAFVADHAGTGAALLCLALVAIVVAQVFVARDLRAERDSAREERDAALAESEISPDEMLPILVGFYEVGSARLNGGPEWAQRNWQELSEQFFGIAYGLHGLMYYRVLCNQEVGPDKSLLEAQVDYFKGLIEGDNKTFPIQPSFDPSYWRGLLKDAGIHSPAGEDGEAD
jgi:hypothetical protein